MNILLASTSTIYGGNYLEYLTEELKVLFQGVKEIVFIPYARPSGISHDVYTEKATKFFAGLNIKVRGIHTFSNSGKAIEKAGAIFTGGGNTFLLVKSLYEYNLIPTLQHIVKEKGIPYLGCSAGTVIGGISMQTTNDMPIVYPPSFQTLELVPFNINPHYLDPIPNLKHNGETRETRLLEFLSQNNLPVVGLREGDWIRVKDSSITLQGAYPARIFTKGKDPYELESGSPLVFE